MNFYRLSRVERSGIGTDQEKIEDFVEEWQFRTLTGLARKRDALLKQGVTIDQMDVTMYFGNWDDSDYSGTLDTMTLKDRGY
jgi:hypothetical protein